MSMFGLLSDAQLYKLHSTEDTNTHPITPFYSANVRSNYHQGALGRAISYGLSSFGYDIRLAADDFRLFSGPFTPTLPSIGDPEQEPFMAHIVDPKNFHPDLLIPQELVSGSEGSYFLLPPGGCALGLSIETFNMPDNVLGLCIGKSTYARSGLLVNATPLEPGWKGRLVLELANLTACHMKVYAGEGIAQILFFRGASPDTTYADRNGKYDNQEGLVLARV